jgi:hypothetical protein
MWQVPPATEARPARTGSPGRLFVSAAFTMQISRQGLVPSPRRTSRAYLQPVVTFSPMVGPRIGPSTMSDEHSNSVSKLAGYGHCAIIVMVMVDAFSTQGRPGATRPPLAVECWNPRFSGFQLHCCHPRCRGCCVTGAVRDSRGAYGGSGLRGDPGRWSDVGGRRTYRPLRLPRKGPSALTPSVVEPRERAELGVKGDSVW